jgi:mannosyltransferase OCH1-like enzyme
MSNLNGDELDAYLLAQKGRMIHQIWFEIGILPKRESRKIFESLKNCRDSWSIKNPTWEYKCWNISECRNFMKAYFTEHLEMYDKYKYDIQRCDCVRYFILYRYGGLYADMDYYCVKPWDEVIDKYPGDFYITKTPSRIGSDINISNALIYSVPGHPYWKYVFVELQKNRDLPIYYGKYITVTYTTGKSIINRVFNRYKRTHKLEYYPYKKFHPFGDTRVDIYAYHLEKRSWMSNDNDIINFLLTDIYLVFIIILSRIIKIFFY